MCYPAYALGRTKPLKQKKSKDAGVDDGNKEPLKKGKRLSKDKASGAGSSTNDSEGADKRPT